MVFKFIILFVLLAVVSAGYLAPIATHTVTKDVHPAYDAVAATHQNVVRSFGGTVSEYSKAVETPYSSAYKEDTRVTNNVYTPAIAKTVTYTNPTVAKAESHVPATTVYTALTTPVVSKTLPAYQQHGATVYAPFAKHNVYTHAQPAAPTPAAAAFYHQHEAPTTATTIYNHGPAGTTYSHNSPTVSAYGSSQTVRYSPAEMVSHMNFDGFGTHWGF